MTVDLHATTTPPPRHLHATTTPTPRHHHATAAPPLRQVRDTLCSLMPPEWEDQLLLASDHADHMRLAIDKLRDVGGALPASLVTKYIRDVSAQVRLRVTVFNGR